jgi:hypothetical protein
MTTGCHSERSEESAFGPAIALICLGLLIATSSILGPLVLGVIKFHVSPGAEAQLVGGEVVSLFVVAPLAVIAGVLWLRGNALAPTLALGPAGYSLYMYVEYIVGAQYERYPGNNEYAFPLYLILIILSWGIALRAWRALASTPLPRLSSGTRRTLAALMLVLNIMFAFAWISSIVAVLAGPSTTPAWQEYEKDQTLFWLVRMMDFGFVIPASFVVAVGLLRRTKWAVKLAYAFLGFQTLMVAAVAGMAIMMAVRSDPAASSTLLAVSAVISLVLAAIFGILLRKLTLASGLESLGTRMTTRRLW